MRSEQINPAVAEGGTARMRNANLARRQAVEAVIGPVAEGLAYLYSALEWRSLFRNSAPDGDYTMHDLFVKCEVPVRETTIRALFEIPLGRDTAFRDSTGI
jgi:hypothetical protein